MRKLGSSPALVSTTAVIDDVVVLPWVPETDTNGVIAASSGRNDLRLSTGTEFSIASRSSGLSADTAVERTTRSAFAS